MRIHWLINRTRAEEQLQLVLDEHAGFKTSSLDETTRAALLDALIDAVAGSMSTLTVAHAPPEDV